MPLRTQPALGKQLSVGSAGFSGLPQHSVIPMPSVVTVQLFVQPHSEPDWEMIQINNNPVKNFYMPARSLIQ